MLLSIWVFISIVDSAESTNCGANDSDQDYDTARCTGFLVEDHICQLKETFFSARCTKTHMGVWCGAPLVIPTSRYYWRFQLKTLKYVSNQTIHIDLQIPSVKQVTSAASALTIIPTAWPTNFLDLVACDNLNVLPRWVFHTERNSSYAPWFCVS